MPDRVAATALSVVASFLIAVVPARGGDAPCVLADVGSFAVVDGGLDVVATDRADIQTGDRLLQLNGRRLGSCADLNGALQDAQQKGVLAVLALRRGTTLQTVLLTLPRATVAVPTVPATTVVVLPTEIPLRSNPAALAPMVTALQAFGVALQLPLTSPQPYGRRFEDLRQTYRELRARDGAIAAADPIIGYYETVAAILSFREHASADRAPRQGESGPGEIARVRRPEGVLEYASDDQVSEWFRRYPFLEDSIERAPGRLGPIENVGRWKPDEAIRLLVERARQETAALAGR